MSSDKKYFNQQINILLDMFRHHEGLIADNFSECMKKFAKISKEIDDLRKELKDLATSINTHRHSNTSF